MILTGKNFYYNKSDKRYLVRDKEVLKLYAVECDDSEHLKFNYITNFWNKKSITDLEQFYLEKIKGVY